jgi:psp operon transcriptional activator
MSQQKSAPRMIGESASFLEMQEHISHVAPLNKPVLFVGERGTGKELVAARLHYLSQRWEHTFLKINCAAMSETLLEAQLFGHEAGAYTGATKQRKGFFERAHGGTLFMDELANTPMPVQEKILRVIEYGEFERLGGNETLTVDVRIVGATNEDLPDLASQGLFREDLLDRLAFAVGMVKEIGGEFFAGFSDKVEKALGKYSWPGNIRELKNVIERAVYQNGDGHITQLVFNPFESPYRLRSSAKVQAAQGVDSAGKSSVRIPDLSTADSFDFKNEVQEFEINLLNQAMEQNQFNQKKAAEFLNLSYHQLRGYLRKYDLLN